MPKKIEFGFAFRPENEQVLLQHTEAMAVEITHERAAADPLRVNRYLGGREYHYVSIHGLRLSPASPELPSRAYMESMRAVGRENGATAYSDHLGVTHNRHDGIDVGHFFPPPFSQAALDCACQNIERVQKFFAPSPFFLENIAYNFAFDAAMSEASFLRQVLEYTGCGLLLDVTNLYANALNHGYNAFAFLSEVLPFASKLQVHLAGGEFDETTGMYLDTHSSAVPHAVWKLYRELLLQSGANVEAVFIERDAAFPMDEEGWTHDFEQARRIAQEVEEVKR